MFPVSRQQRALLIILLTGACLLASVILLPRMMASPQAPSLSTAPGCDLSAGPCTSQGAERSMTLTLASGPARAGDTVQFSLQLKGIQPRSVTLQLEGRDMYMGINRLQLEESADQPGLWLGSTELAICTTRLMQWRARIEAQTDTAPITAHYEFSAQ